MYYALSKNKFLDLTNAKSNYKYQLAEPLKKKSKFYEVGGRDLCAYLKLGDKVHYKNHNTYEVEKWLDGIFNKRISTNIVCIVISH